MRYCNGVSRRAISKADEAEFIDRYQKGERLVALAKDYECSTQALRRTIVRLGLTPRKPGVQHHYADEQIAEMVTEWEGGVAVRQIARRLGVAQDVPTRILREEGCKVQRRARPPGPFGPDSPSWRGGRREQNGYIKIWVSADDPMASMRDGTGYVAEHRLVMARSLGRPLTRHETVHHKNTDHSDNAIGNLQLRQGQHGKGGAFICMDCGSHNIEATVLAVEVHESTGDRTHG